MSEKKQVTGKEVECKADIFVPFKTSDVKILEATEATANSPAKPKRALIAGRFAKIGVNKNHLQWTYEALADGHTTMRNVPVQYMAEVKSLVPEHNNYSANTVGWVLNTEMRQDGAYYEAEITNPEAIEKLSRKTSNGIPEIAGVSMACKAEALCSICGENMVTGDCTHFPGQDYDGQVCNMVAQNPEFYHLLLTNFPADDTPIDAVSISATLNRPKREEKEGKDMKEGKETEVEALKSASVNSPDSSVALKEEIASLKAKLAESEESFEKLKASVSNLEKEKATREASEIKRLAGEAASLEAKVKGLDEEAEEKLEATLKEQGKEALSARIDALKGLEVKKDVTAKGKTSGAPDLNAVEDDEEEDGDEPKSKEEAIAEATARIEKHGTAGALLKAAEESGYAKSIRESPNKRSLPLSAIRKVGA